MPIVGAPSTTALVVLDPVTEDATNVEVALSDNYGLLAHAYPVPPVSAQWASSVSTEGAVLSSARHENRTITITVDVTGLGALQALEAKLAKLYRDGGTLKRVDSDGREIVFDVLIMDGYEPSFDVTHHIGGVTSVTFSLTCAPYGRGAPETTGLHTETTLPANIFAETAIKGDVPALGRLVVSDAQNVNQWWLVWGVQSRYYDAATTAALFYEAEGRTRLGGASLITGGTVASGGVSNNTVRGTLTTSYQAFLSTQATGGGAHLTHVGTFRVFTRIWQSNANANDVTVAWQWGIGDFTNPTQNAETTLPVSLKGRWLLVDLGTMTLPKATAGTQRWEGRIIAKSTVAGNLLDIDYLMFVPVDEGSGEASAINRAFTPSSFSARDEFDQTAGALSGKTLPVGGTWSGTGDADDFSVTGSGGLQRTGISDADLNTGRYAIAGTATATDIAIALDVDRYPNGSGWQLRRGMLARYTDTNNWVQAGIAQDGGSGAGFSVRKRVAGTVTTLASIIPHATALSSQVVSLLFIARASGAWQLSANGSVVLTGYDADLATGGALATGKFGIYDAVTNAVAATRLYDNFWAAVPPYDAAIFASQSLEVRSDGVIREDPSGTGWMPPSRYEGDYLRVPPSGPEGRTVRFIVKAARQDPFTSDDSSIDDIAAQLIYTPRYLVVPEG